MRYSFAESLSLSRCVLVGSFVLAYTNLFFDVETRAEDPKNLIYFGNSLTNATCCGATERVPNLVADIAEAAGRPRPFFINASINGMGLGFHLNRPVTPQIIEMFVPDGDTWDHVVLQDSMLATTRLGDVTAHVSNALGMYQLVAANSPAVEPIMYETWARRPGNVVYTGDPPDFPGGPSEMQAEVRAGYMMSAANINATAGMDVARIARVGDAWEFGGFPLNFYSDPIHANNRGTLLAAMVIYGTIYEDPDVSDIDLTSILGELSLSAADGELLTGLADQSLAIPEPGSISLVLLGVAGFVSKRRPRC